MRAEAQSVIDDGWTERLTQAIRLNFADIEKRHPGNLDYDTVPLRGAIERSVYERGVQNSAAAPGLPQQVSTDRGFDIWAYSKAWARLISHVLGKPIRRHRPPAEVANPEFIFHVLRPRFVDFFWPIMQRLGTHRCAVLCEPGYGVEAAAARCGLAVCDRVPARLQLDALRCPPGAIFPLYANAVSGLLTALGTLRSYHPRAVVFAEAASSREEIVARASQSLGIATIRVQYGRAGLLSPGYYEMPYDRMLMWGDGFVERLRGVSPDCQYIVTGSPLMDRLAQGAWRSEQPIFPNDKPIVSVISQPECANISRQDYRSLVSVVERTIAKNDTVNVLVRLHPADKAQDFDRLAKNWPNRVRVTTPADIALEAVIGRSMLVIGLYSTVLSEAAAAGVLPVVIRLGERHRIFPAPEDEGAAVLATTPDEAVEKILLHLKDVSARNAFQPGMRIFAEKYFGPTDGGATGRIVAHIENAAGQVSA